MNSDDRHSLAVFLFQQAYRHAEFLDACEKGLLPKQLALPCEPRCKQCGKVSENLLKPLLCSGCHAVIYCSRQCQVIDWKNDCTEGRHKDTCPQFKECMKRLPYFRSQLLQFPWGRIESDGTFSSRVFLAHLGVYGSGPEFGYWSVPGDTNVHHSDESAFIKGYVYGAMLLRNQWPTEVEGWKMEHRKAQKNIIPSLFFTDEFPPPEKVRPGQIVDWRSWYAWRGLNMESPAAVLMSYPLTVYHILTDILQAVDNTSTSTGRRSLHVHYIGAEKELNFLPLFSELALLLPHTDITLVFFGKPVFDLVHNAKKKHPNSLATKDIVWTYAAPDVIGGGSVKIELYSKSRFWDEGILKQYKPNVLVGLNAGLFTYGPWGPVVVSSLFHRIPFGTTDYDEPTSQAMIRALIKGLAPRETSVPVPLNPESFPITPNPFHLPGQCQARGGKVPDHVNGFVTRLYKAQSE